mmetsp:Transcript_37710/g.96468  ORF Transcript_37710/g.96468 Transcript_37710/m.96468 type:complete len:212 (-) Transcript_37710:1634-2269(-)
MSCSVASPVSASDTCRDSPPWPSGLRTSPKERSRTICSTAERLATAGEVRSLCPAAPASPASGGSASVTRLGARHMLTDSWLAFTAASASAICCSVHTPCTARLSTARVRSVPQWHGSTLRCVMMSSKSSSSTISASHSAMTASATRMSMPPWCSASITSITRLAKVVGKGHAKAVRNHWLAYSIGGMPCTCRCLAMAGCSATSSSSNRAR